MSPEDDLKAKQADLKKAQADIADPKCNMRARAQVDIKALEAKIADVHQALAGYADSSKSNLKLLSDAKNTIASKAAIAEAVIKDTKGQIDQKITDFDMALSTQETSVSEARTAAETAAKASADADATVLTKQGYYDAEKRSPKDRDAALKELAGLLDQANKTEAQGDYVGLYFLVGEAKSLAEKINIPSADEYGASLRSAQNDLDKAKQDATEKKEKAVQLLAAYNEAKKRVRRSEGITAGRFAGLSEASEAEPIVRFFSDSLVS